MGLTILLVHTIECSFFLIALSFTVYLVKCCVTYNKAHISLLYHVFLTPSCFGKY